MGLQMRLLHIVGSVVAQNLAITNWNIMGGSEIKDAWLIDIWGSIGKSLNFNNVTLQSVKFGGDGTGQS